MTVGLLVLAVFILAFAMVANRLSRTVLTAPMVFLAFGFLLSNTGLFPHVEAEKLLHVTAEVALVLLLFLDAAQIDRNSLRLRRVWPARMLLIGLPLTILFGALAAWLFFADMAGLCALSCGLHSRPDRCGAWPGGCHQPGRSGAPA